MVLKQLSTFQGMKMPVEADIQGGEVVMATDFQQKVRIKNQFKKL